MPNWVDHILWKNPYKTDLIPNDIPRLYRLHRLNSHPQIFLSHPRALCGQPSQVSAWLVVKRAKQTSTPPLAYYGADTCTSHLLLLLTSLV